MGDLENLFVDLSININPYGSEKVWFCVWTKKNRSPGHLPTSTNLSFCKTRDEICNGCNYLSTLVK